MDKQDFKDLMVDRIDHLDDEIQDATSIIEFNERGFTEDQLEFFKQIKSLRQKEVAICKTWRDNPIK